MPCDLYAELFREDLQLPRRGDAADLTDVDPDKVNQLFGDQPLPLLAVVKQLPLRKGGAGLLPQAAEPGQLFQRQGVFQKKELQGLQLLGELNGLDGGDPLMDIVDELDFVPLPLADPLEQLDGVPQIASL